MGIAPLIEEGIGFSPWGDYPLCADQFGSPLPCNGRESAMPNTQNRVNHWGNGFYFQAARKSLLNRYCPVWCPMSPPPCAGQFVTDRVAGHRLGGRVTHPGAFFFLSVPNPSPIGKFLANHLKGQTRFSAGFDPKGVGRWGRGQTNIGWVGTPPKQWVVQVTDFWPRTKRRAEKNSPRSPNLQKCQKNCCKVPEVHFWPFWGGPG